jgi:hypothetical protein
MKPAHFLQDSRTNEMQLSTPLALLRCQAPATKPAPEALAMRCIPPRSHPYLIILALIIIIIPIIVITLFPLLFIVLLVLGGRLISLMQTQKDQYETQAIPRHPYNTLWCSLTTGKDST